MNIINFLLAILASYLGLAAGLVLRKYTSQEVEAGKKWLIFSQRLLVLVIIGLFMYFMDLKAIWIIAAVFLASTAMYQFTIKTPVFYALFGVFIGLAKNDLNLFVLITSLTFMYGLISGSMHEKSNWKYLAANGVFFVAAVLMWFA